MSDLTGMRRALVDLKHDARICKKCKAIIVEKLERLEKREADWIHSTFFSESRIPA